MVSGWDKHPGPDNDYAPRPWSKQAIAVLIVLVISFFGGYAYLLVR